MVRNPHHYRIITPILISLCTFVFVPGLGWFINMTFDGFEKHLDKIDAKLESQAKINGDLESKISFIRGRCCKPEASHEGTGG